ncbi:MAG: TMEM175 family protein [Thaumarchaeota archaeon]|nr:TMEM175 family protein [Nitrososphaerota archaeon]
MSTDASMAGLSKARVEALTDGIFATVMTVLVLTLSVPVIAGGSLSNVQLGQDVDAAVQGLLPDMLSYVLSFLLLAVMWMSHHYVFHYIAKINRQLLWLNIVFLLTIGFIPFSTALLGRYPLVQLSVIIYGANVAGVAIAMQTFLQYAVRSKMLIAEGDSKALMGRIIFRWRLGVIIYSSAILVSFASTEVSIAIYVVALCYYVISSSLRTGPIG